jgi:hypothetical protein
MRELLAVARVPAIGECAGRLAAAAVSPPQQARRSRAGCLYSAGRIQRVDPMHAERLSVEQKRILFAGLASARSGWASGGHGTPRRITIQRRGAPRFFFAPSFGHGLSTPGEPWGDVLSIVSPMERENMGAFLTQRRDTPEGSTDRRVDDA